MRFMIGVLGIWVFVLALRIGVPSGELEPMNPRALILILLRV